MNLILFSRDEIDRPLAGTDARAAHLKNTLRRAPGASFDLGIIDGPRGKGLIEAIEPDGTVRFRVEWSDEPPPLQPITLLAGLPRPQTARKILQEATALGVARLFFVHSERTDPNYARSTLWTTDEWRSHLIEGAQQAFCTRLPAVECGLALADALLRVPTAGCRVALDNYEAPASLGDTALPGATECLAIAIGPERGWGPLDRTQLRSAGFALAHLGNRVLRCETACVAALAILKSRLRWL